MNLADVIKKPVITEKSMQKTAFGEFAFVVDRKATKLEIKKALKKFFGVNPLRVRTMRFKGKIKKDRRSRYQTTLPDWKKAMVTLKEGEKIDLFETSE